MTQIKLHTVDQHLIVTKKVKIAAGDINSVSLHVEFDEPWGEFPEKKAIFSNSSVNNGGTMDVLLIENSCIVPHEVLSTDGTLSISITAYKRDETIKKTSTTAKLKVLESLTDASTTVEPSLDLYMQYLAAINTAINPITVEVAAQLAANLEAVTGLLAEQAELLSPVLLWENPSPEEEFSAQRIPLDLTQYKRFTVVFRWDKGAESCFERQTLVKNIQHEEALFETYRDYTITDEFVEFFSAYGGSSPNAHLIPYKLIGFKY